MANACSFYTLLLQFQRIPLSFYSNQLDAAREAIQANMLSYGRNSNSRSADNIDATIQKICEEAIKTLDRINLEESSYIELLRAKGAKNGHLAKEYPFQFKKNRLTNVGLFLSSESSEIMSILPYLLTCYTYNAPKTGPDPYDGSFCSQGWNDIFDKNSSSRTDSNRSHTIREIAQFFTFPVSAKILNGEFFFSDDIKIEQMIAADIKKHSMAREHSALGIFAVPMSELNEDQRLFLEAIDKLTSNTDFEDESCSYFLSQVLNANKHSGEEFLKKEAVLRLKGDKALCWDLYSRFAAFCQACKDNPNVNLSLSMAMFANLWECKDVEIKNSRELINLANKEGEDYVLQQFTEENVNSDYIREEISNISRYCVNDSIYSHALDAHKDFFKAATSSRNNY